MNRLWEKVGSSRRATWVFLLVVFNLLAWWSFKGVVIGALVTILTDMIWRDR